MRIKRIVAVYFPFPHLENGVEYQGAYYHAHHPDLERCRVRSPEEDEAFQKKDASLVHNERQRRSVTFVVGEALLTGMARTHCVRHRTYD